MEDNTWPSSFEQTLQQCPQPMCKRWCDSCGVAYTAADLIAMATLVLKREKRLAKREIDAVQTRRPV